MALKIPVIDLAPFRDGGAADRKHGFDGLQLACLFDAHRGQSLVHFYP